MGGPGRRQREMLRRLEELDRLDLMAATPEEVLWPGGRSSRHDPRAWTPGRHRDVSSSHWWERHPSLGFVVIALVIGGWVAGPRIPAWIDRLLPARAALAAGEDRPPALSGSTTRLLPPVTVTDVPRSSQYSFLATQEGSSEPVTFDPCRPIHFVVRDAPGAGRAGRDAVTRAVAEVSAATGLKFVDDGDTDEVRSSNRPLYQPDRYAGRWAPVLIAWSDPSETPELDGRTAGIGGGLPIRDTHGHLTFVSGTVWLDTPSLAQDLQTPQGSAGVQAVIMHELGHVLGAGHVQDSRELMAAENTGVTDFGPGDRYALSVLGQGKCVPGL